MENDESYVLRIDHGPNNPRNGEGTFITLQDGTILHAYSKFYGPDGTEYEDYGDSAPARICARVSADHGLTWTDDDRVLVENEGRANVMSASLLRLQDGRIALFHVRKNGVDDCSALMRTSSDEAGTWSDPILVTQAPGYFVLNNDRVIQLKSGRIVVPVALHRMTRKPRDIWDFGAYDWRGLVLFYLSDDGGETWREAADWLALPKHPYIEERNYTCEEMKSLFEIFRPQIPFGYGLQEPGVVELTDGRVYGWARTNVGRQFEFLSDDNGEHWTVPQPSWFCAPCSPLSIKRLSTGDLLAIWNDHDRQQWRHLPYPESGYGGKDLSSNSNRTPLATAISSDDGKTWKHRRLLEDDPLKSLCYTAIYQVSDHVLLSYFDGGKTEYFCQRYCVRRLPLAWFFEE